MHKLLYSIILMYLNKCTRSNGDNLVLVFIIIIVIVIFFTLVGNVRHKKGQVKTQIIVTNKTTHTVWYF